MANPYESQLTSLQEQSKAAREKLLQSPTAFGGETVPTSQDISAQSKYNTLQKQILGVRKKSQTEKWYGPQDTKAPVDESTEGVKPKGMIMGALDVIQRPARLIEGAVAHAVGEGEGKDVWESMSKNQKSSKTFSDLLKSKNVPYAISAPLGFALDVAFDPVNWITAGTAALIPRIGVGLAKAGPKGALLGAKSSLINKATFVEKYTPTPFIKKTGMYKGAIGKMQKAGVESTEEYNKLIGKDIASMVGGYGVPASKLIGAERAAKIGVEAPSAPMLYAGKVLNPSGSQYRASIGDMIEMAADLNPTTKRLFETLNYSNKEWMRLARIKDSLQNSLGISGTTFNDAVRAWREGKPIDEFLARNVEAGKQTPIRKPIIDWGDADTSIPNDAAINQAIASLPTSGSRFADPAVAKKYADIMEEGAEAATDTTGMYKTLDGEENARRITSMSEAMEQAGRELGTQVLPEDIAKLIGSGALDETGIQWYDNMIKGISEMKKSIKTKDGQEKVWLNGKVVLEGLQSHISVFKVAKVAANPSSWMNAIVGNATMLWMMGINVFDKQYLGHLNNVRKLTMGSKDSSIIMQKLYENPEMVRIMTEDSGTFSRITGLQPNKAADIKFATEAIQRMDDAGISTMGIKVEDFAEELRKTIREGVTDLMESKEMLSAQQKIIKTAGGISKPGVKGSTEIATEQLKKGLTQSDLGTSWGANELASENFAMKYFDKIKDRAASADATLSERAINLVFNKSVAGYDHVDQGYKLSTIMHLTGTGITEGELTKVARFVQMNPEDVTKVIDKGTIRYKISGEKAMEVASEAFLNYNAMPAMIKMLRSAPLVGNPFASFMYGMLLKTANTAVYNTSVFNKVSFAMNDFGGTTTPQEKKALKGQYYSYLDTPTMFRLPWKDTSPVYLNLANILPYYSFNMFTPSERKYSDIYPDKLINLIDNTPFVKDPVGSVIFDYIIQPMILKDSIPVGQFNQPLYPYEAGFGTKSLYAARQLTESIIPGVVSPLGMAAAGAPDVVKEALPGYGLRKFSRALIGENPQGISSQESALSKTTRAGAGYFGIPLQAPMNLKYQDRNNQQ